MIEMRAAELGRMLAVLSILFLTQIMNAETATPPGGIEGAATISPVRGGPSRQGVSDFAPLANTSFFVESAAGKVATFKTDPEGHFKVELPPGKYTIRIERPQMKRRGCALRDIEVTEGNFKKIQLNCDSGMR